MNRTCCAVVRVHETNKFTISGGNDERVTPVPIPNTEVKPLSADGTWLDTARESRSSPDSFIFLSSSMAEHSAVNRVVVGSSPTWGAVNPCVSHRSTRIYFLYLVFCVAQAMLKAIRKKNSTTTATVPRDRVVATYSASSPRSAKRGMMKGAGSMYCRISAMSRDLS